MAKFLWMDTFSIDDEHTDNQHKKLVEIANDFYESLQRRQALSVVESIIIRLYDYTKVHFADEEKLMESLNYPGLEEHHQTHIDLIKKIDDELVKYEKDKAIYPIHDMCAFIKDWLVNHILGMDKKIEPYVLKTKS